VIPRLERTLIPKRISKYHLRHLPKCEKVRVRSLYIIEYVESSVAARHDIRDIDENQTCSEKHNATLMIYECSFINVILLSKNVYFFSVFFRESVCLPQFTFQFEEKLFYSNKFSK
jgi:hypothetical protein